MRSLSSICTSTCASRRKCPPHTLFFTRPNGIAGTLHLLPAHHESHPDGNPPSRLLRCRPCVSGVGRSHTRWSRTTPAVDPFLCEMVCHTAVAAEALPVRKPLATHWRRMQYLSSRSLHHTNRYHDGAHRLPCSTTTVSADQSAKAAPPPQAVDDPQAPRKETVVPLGSKGQGNRLVVCKGIREHRLQPPQAIVSDNATKVKPWTYPAVVHFAGGKALVRSPDERTFSLPAPASPS